MKLKKQSKDTEIISSIGDIKSEMRDLLGGITKSVNDNSVFERACVENIVSAVEEGNETLKLILFRLDDISRELKREREPWYMRVFCSRHEE